MTTVQSKENRISVADGLRGFAIIAITLLHSINHFNLSIFPESSSTIFNWTDPVMIKFSDSADAALYTNQIVPYYRAPHLFLGFPTQYVDRKFSAAAMQALPDPDHRQKRMKFSPRFGTVITNGLFMSSYDGSNFHRWDEVFIPGSHAQKVFMLATENSFGAGGGEPGFINLDKLTVKG